MSLVLGIDLGTQALKALVYDPDPREVRALAAAPLELHQRDDGTAEQHVEWWVSALREAMSLIDPKLRSAVKAIGVSGQQHGFVPVNAAGEVLASVKLWCDTSTAGECETIMARLGGANACIEVAGNPILPGYTASKVLWFKNTHPALYKEMDCLLLPHDYLNFYLTGERCMEMGDASGTGFLDVQHRVWSDKMLHAIDSERDVKECLPQLRIDNEAIGELRTDVAQQLGLQPGIPVSIGGGDNMMGAIGTGNVRRGCLTMSLGTSGTVYAHSDEPIVDPMGEIAAFCSSTGGWLPLLCTMNCTVSSELMRNLLNVDLDRFEAIIANASIGAEGVLTLPFFNGERTPNLPHAKGCVFGIDSNNARPENLLRSSVEGASFALRYGIDRLAELGVSAEEIVLTGGGSKSVAWRRIISNLCDAPVTVLAQEEGAASGAALQALEILSDEPLESLVETHVKHLQDSRCDPEPDAVKAYGDIYQDYLRAVEIVTQLYTTE
jgi:xylulokinase